MRTPILLTVFAAMTMTAGAQCPTPGSDGALTLAANLGTQIFDPVALSIGDANNVFCFTSVTIGDNSTLAFRANKMRNPNSPVFFYIQGAFSLGSSSGLVLTGESGAVEFTFPALNASGLSQQQQLQLRRPSIPGPGGYPGGLGLSAGIAPEAGGGPGGGQPGTLNEGVTCNGGGAAHFSAALDYFSVGTLISTATYANVNLLPMYGGSGGGGGGGNSSADFGGIGGAGGGAIRIVAASFSFASGSQIIADGGSAFQFGANMACGGGGGAGGSIHLVAPGPIPTLPNVHLEVVGRGGGNNAAPDYGGNGLIRISSGDTTCNCTGGTVFGPPFTPPIQTGTPALRIVSIGGQAVPAQPGGSYISPDVVLNTSSPVTIQIAATNIPVGTVVKLRITSEVQADQVISCAPLAGTLANATASCSATYAQLGSMSSVRANW